MSSRRRYLSLALLPLAVLSADGQTLAPDPATIYLQNASDRFQQTVDVYTDADAAGNHFAYRGEFDSSQQQIKVPPMDEISADAECFAGITCITATFDPTQLDWGGWYFMNGVLGAHDRQPQENWGTIPNAGYDLTGATELRFWAKGETGNEIVEFFAFGVGYSDQGNAPYPDSSRKVSTRPIALTTAWTEYHIPLNGVDIHYVLGGFGWVAASKYNSQPITFYLDDIQYLKSRPGVPRFLVSYETIKSDNAFDTVTRNAGFTYDNAVALIALLASGDLSHSRTTANALIYAQSNDRFFGDWRLRNAYQGGDIMLPPGWMPNGRLNTARIPGWYKIDRQNWFEDETQVGTSTGNVAWAMLSLLYFYESTHLPAYRIAADRLGDWVIGNAWDFNITGGFTAGYTGWEGGCDPACPTHHYVNGQCKRLYKATEHNIDLYAAFSRLFVLEHLPRWAQAAQHAKMFLLSTWDPMEGKFWAGTLEDGLTLSKDVIPADIQAWALEALGSQAAPYMAALNYVELHHKTSLGYGFKQNGNNSCGDWTWFEGTSQIALAYLLTGNEAKWQSILSTARTAELNTGAMPATDGPCLNTGFFLDDNQPWLYYPRAHVGATGWISLAELGFNPFRADLYTPRLESPKFRLSARVGSSTTGTVRLQNPGTGVLEIRALSVQGVDAHSFTVSNTCGTALPAGRDCAIEVTFTPSAVGPRTASLRVTVIDMPSGLEVTFPEIPISGVGMPPIGHVPQRSRREM